MWCESLWKSLIALVFLVKQEARQSTENVDVRGGTPGLRIEVLL